MEKIPNLALDIRQADVATFGFYLECFAVDTESCYCTNSRLIKADPATFRCLSYTYFKDRNHVWTIFGEVKKADAASFVAVDSGVVGSLGSWSAFGFGKDANGVYYTGLYGWMGWLPGVDSTTFLSCGEGYFRYDRSDQSCEGEIWIDARGCGSTFRNRRGNAVPPRNGSRN